MAAAGTPLAWRFRVADAPGRGNVRVAGVGVPASAGPDPRPPKGGTPTPARSAAKHSPCRGIEGSAPATQPDAGHNSPAFVDLFAGEVRIDLRRVGGDFVVWKAAGTPAYQLAVVVDDAEMGVTEVVRGDDLIPSTPRQLLLYRALGLSPPRFAHVPLVVGGDGRRLAKRHGDTRLSALRDAGVTPEALVGLLAWSCGWQAEVTPVSAADLLPRFRLDAIPKEPFTLTAGLLKAIGYDPVGRTA
ncbi:MAG: hypothetical protein K2X82_14990 [Gemmataceae bacterium]|nr:hypothetical protein [Gemmataceae bacterium]